MTAVSTPKTPFIPSASFFADSSESRGRSVTRSPPETFDASTPALADIIPPLVSTMSLPLSGFLRSILMTFVVSENMTSTRRGSFPKFFATDCANGEGSTSLRSTIRPSAFDTTFWANTTTSPSSMEIPASPAARERIRTRSSPGFISGIPGTGIIESGFGEPGIRASSGQDLTTGKIIV